MNTKLITLATVAIVILASLSGCIKVEFINPNEARESKVAIHTPTDTPAELLPTDEPLPTATTKSTATTKPTKTQTSKPMVTIVPIVPLLFEKFDAMDSGYSKDLWWSWGPFELGSVSQTTNGIRFDYDVIGFPQLISKKSWSINDIGFLQGKFRVISMDDKENAEIAFTLHSQLTSETHWQAVCGIGNYLKLTYNCRICIFNPTRGETQCEYQSFYYPVNYGDWHISKMEINSLTHELVFYLDDEIIGRFEPSNFEDLRTKSFNITFGVGSDPLRNHIIAEFDDILLAQYP